jgi:hypothetical protein
MGSQTEPHVVGQGEYLTAIAYARGVTVDGIWNDPANASLRAVRANPEVLAPGDVVYVPVIEKNWNPVNVGETAQMTADPAKVTIELALTMDDDSAPTTDPTNAGGPPPSDPSSSGSNALAGKTYRIEGLPGDPLTGPIGPDGTIKFEAPVTVREVLLTIEELGVTCPLIIGGLDPATEASGQRQRLRQLGYTDDDEDGCDLEEAFRAFQQQSGIEQSGKPDDATLDALVKEHGS